MPATFSNYFLLSLSVPQSYGTLENGRPNDGMVNPNLYGGNQNYNLGLCFVELCHMELTCPFGENCIWRHTGPIRVEAVTMILKGGAPAASRIRRFANAYDNKYIRANGSYVQRRLPPLPRATQPSDHRRLPPDVVETQQELDQLTAFLDQPKYSRILNIWALERTRQDEQANTADQSATPVAAATQPTASVESEKDEHSDTQSTDSNNTVLGANRPTTPVESETEHESIMTPSTTTHSNVDPHPEDNAAAHDVVETDLFHQEEEDELVEDDMMSTIDDL